MIPLLYSIICNYSAKLRFSARKRRDIFTEKCGIFSNEKEKMTRKTRDFKETPLNLQT